MNFDDHSNFSSVLLVIWKREIVSQLPKFDSYNDNNPEQILIEKDSENEIRKRITVLIEKLTDRQKEIVYLKYTEGLNYDEIAEILQIDKASARTLLFRTLKAIKERSSNNSLILMLLIGSILSKKNRKNDNSR